MPENYSTIPETFLECFLGSFSSEHPEINHECHDKLLNNPIDTVFFLLQMIYEGMVNGNQQFLKLLDIVIAFFNKMLTQNSELIRHLNSEDMKLINSSISDKILYFLPLAAQEFQMTNDIKKFELLFSSFNSINIVIEETVDLFNDYVFFLLNNDHFTQHHIIISFYFYNALSGENIKDGVHQKIIMLIAEYLQNLPQCDLDNDLNLLIYEKIFIKLIDHLQKFILMSEISFDRFFILISNFLSSCIQKMKYCQENKVVFNFNNHIKIINLILHFFYTSFGPALSVDDSKRIPLTFSIQNPFVPQIIHYFYRNGVILSRFSNFACSFSLIKLVCMNFHSLLKRLTPTDQKELVYYAHFIMTFASFSLEEMEELEYAQSNFYFDNYDVDLSEEKIFFLTKRQCLARFLSLSFNSEKMSPFNDYLLKSLDMIPKKKEIHLFIISQVLRIYSKSIFLQNQPNLGEILNRIVVNLITFFSDIIKDKLNNSESFSSIYTQCLIFSYYYFITQSFRVLNDDQIGIFNQDINNIYILCNNENHPYRSILFTFLCNLSFNLFNRNQLLDQSQIGDQNQLPAQLNELFLFITSHNPLCLTNDANEFAVAVSVKINNPQFLIETFNNYLFQCEIFFQNLIPNCEGFQVLLGGKMDISDALKKSKDYSYKENFYSESVKRIANIISLFNDFPFDQQKLLNFVKFILNFGDDWEFIEESLLLVKNILLKAPNCQEWAKIYIDEIKNADRDHEYGEWVVPLINLVSYRFNDIDQEFFNYLINEMKDFCNSLVPDLLTYFLQTEDAALFFNLMSRLFELSFFKQFVIPNDYLQFFCQLSEMKPNELNLGDFEPLNHNIAEILLKLASFIAGLQIDPGSFQNFFSEIIKQNLIINDELRYIIIFMIDNYIDENSRPLFAELRQKCLDDSIPKNTQFLENYSAKSFIFQSSVPHPIFNLYHCEGFVFNTV